MYNVKDFSAFYTGTLARRLVVSRKLSGDIAKKIDPNRPKGYSRLYDIMLSIQRRGNKEAGGDVWNHT